MIKSYIGIDNVLNVPSGGDIQARRVPNISRFKFN